jgi:hypothetical protein
VILFLVVVIVVLGVGLAIVGAILGITRSALSTERECHDIDWLRLQDAWVERDEARGRIAILEKNAKNLEVAVGRANDRTQAAEAECDRVAARFEAARETWAVRAAEMEADLSAARRSLEAARQDFEMRGRSHTDAVRCSAEREKLVEGFARDILTALGREA